MKSIKNLIILSLVLLFSLNLNAQSINKKSLSELTKIVTQNLKSSSEGVAESSIFVSLQFKNRYPKADNKIIVDALNDLASNSNNAKISYKAQLAKIYFENPELFKDVKVNTIFDDQKVFEQISEKLNSVVLASEF
ncbi:MAG: hypothetical protein HYS24_10875 [Ignavibacteriales bacterium]|nr:hypothetical protein [Ignavibacteriales bacterium]